MPRKYRSLSKSAKRRRRLSSSYFRRLKHPMKNKEYAERLERCVLKLKSSWRGRRSFNPYAICHASLKGSTRRRRSKRY